MTATKEQIVAEAERRWENELGEREWSVVDHIIDVIREGWTPPEPVDPDLVAFREWRASLIPNNSTEIATGYWEQQDQAEAYRAGARMAREQERERAKVLEEYVEVDARSANTDRRRWAQARLAKYNGEA
jgi:hypothetical protein